jgi:predicted RNase H-like nuclease
MTAVLGIDAAWTGHNASGYALIEKTNGRWRLRAAAPNIQTFAAACGLEGDRGQGAELALRCAERVLDGSLPELVAVDMPMSRKKIEGRRDSDKKVSSRFGAAKCATHSPSKDRPGEVGRQLQEACEARGYFLITSTGLLPAFSLAEVYPHPALLRLMNVPERVCYKVNKTGTYWRGKFPKERLARVQNALRSIVERLDDGVGGVAVRVGEQINQGRGFSALKPVEDMIDAIIAAWVGTRILEGGAEPIGDEDSAIWIPNPPLPTPALAGVA